MIRSWKKWRGAIMAHPERQCDDCPALIDEECVVDTMVTLSSYRPGETGTIAQICGNPEFRLRMMEMGFIKGTEVKVIKFAPLSDPIEFLIKGYHVTLRRAQANNIIMNRPEKAA
jgi:Fe2+ transport system protein FeoA